VSAQLERVAAERTRLLAPPVLGGVVLSLVVSEPMGISLSPWVIAYNILSIAILAVLSLGRPQPSRSSHANLALVWWAPVGGTLTSALATGDPQLATLFIVELVALSVILESRIAAASAVAAIALYAGVLDALGAPLGFALSSAVTAAVFGLILQQLVRSSLIRAEHHRRAQAALAAQLATRLDEVLASEAERAALQERVLHAQRLEAVGTLAAGIAHDLNNVLAAIANHADGALVAHPAHAGAIRSILDQVGRSAELTRGVLAFSSQGRYRKQRVRVAAILGDIVPMLERAQPACPVEIRSATGDAEVEVEVDRVQLGQVIANLCSNAGHAMPAGGRIVVAIERVRLDADAARRADLEAGAGAYVRIEVIDSGTGMDEATRRRVFEPFFTTKPRGTGTGLGLALVWGVVRGHGGGVAIASELGEGTRVTLLLPEAVAPAATVEARPAAGGAGTILVVDDETAVRTSTARMLTRRGYRVLTASNGAEALAVHAEHAAEIGLVILDMNMPVMDGATCFTELRTRSTVPVLIATGYAVDEILRGLLDRGASLIEKPYAAADLVREVQRLLASTGSGPMLAAPPERRSTPKMT
jgi:signal transduction histidine kinase